MGRGAGEVCAHLKAPHFMPKGHRSPSCVRTGTRGAQTHHLSPPCGQGPVPVL